MIINTDILRRDTIQLLNQIEAQIQQVQAAAHDRGCKPEELRDTSGGWVMIPLLLAKAQAYGSLVQLNQSRKK